MHMHLMPTSPDSALYPRELTAAYQCTATIGSAMQDLHAQYSMHCWWPLQHEHCPLFDTYMLMSMDNAHGRCKTPSDSVKAAQQVVKHTSIPCLTRIST